MAEKSEDRAGAGSAAGVGLGAIICDGDKARGSVTAAAGVETGRDAAAGAGIERGAGGAAVAAADAGAGRAGGGADAASSSAMICLMDERISSMDGSLVAGLFIEASFNA
jgi:hypothetical protein